MLSDFEREYLKGIAASLEKAVEEDMRKACQDTSVQSYFLGSARGHNAGAILLREFLSVSDSQPEASSE